MLRRPMPIEGAPRRETVRYCSRCANSGLPGAFENGEITFQDGVSQFFLGNILLSSESAMIGNVSRNEMRNDWSNLEDYFSDFARYTTDVIRMAISVNIYISTEARRAVSSPPGTVRQCGGIYPRVNQHTDGRARHLTLRSLRIAEQSHPAFYLNTSYLLFHMLLKRSSDSLSRF